MEKFKNLIINNDYQKLNLIKMYYNKKLSIILILYFNLKQIIMHKDIKMCYNNARYD